MDTDIEKVTFQLVNSTSGTLDSPHRVCDHIDYGLHNEEEMFSHTFLTIALMMTEVFRLKVSKETTQWCNVCKRRRGKRMRGRGRGGGGDV